MIIQATLTLVPYLLCSGTQAVSGDVVIITLDPLAFPDASPITATIVSTETVQTPVRDCAEIECGTSYVVEFDDSQLPEGLSELRNCDVQMIRCSDCCERMQRLEYLKVVLQSAHIDDTDTYTQLRATEDLDLYGIATWIDFWPSVYGVPGTHTDVVFNLGVSSVGGNSYSADIAGTQVTMLRATPETWKNTTFPAPIRIEAGRQLWVRVTDDGSTDDSVRPYGLGITLKYKLASE